MYSLERMEDSNPCLKGCQKEGRAPYPYQLRGANQEATSLIMHRKSFIIMSQLRPGQ